MNVVMRLFSKKQPQPVEMHGDMTVTFTRGSVSLTGLNGRIDFVHYDPPFVSPFHSVMLTGEQYERMGRPVELKVTVKGINYVPANGVAR